MATRQKSEPHRGHAALSSKNQPYSSSSSSSYNNHARHPSRFSFESKLSGSRSTPATSALYRANAANTATTTTTTTAASAGEGLSFADSLTTASAGIDLNLDSYQEQQSDVNFSESDFALPSSPPIFTTKPLFRSRHSHTGSLGSVEHRITANNNQQQNWTDASQEDMSITPVQRPSRFANLSRDRNILKKLSANPVGHRGIYQPSSPAGMSGMALPSEFDTDGMDANTPKLERALVRAAEKEIDGLGLSRYGRVRAASNQSSTSSAPAVTAVAVMTGSEDSTESRRSRVALMSTLSRRKEPASRPHSFSEAVDIKVDLPGIQRSVSSGSSDGRRHRRDILNLGFESPSRRRRLRNLQKRDGVFDSAETPRARVRSPPRPAVTRSFTTPAAEPPMDDSKFNSTIDWLAAASPDAPEDTAPKDRNRSVTSKSSTPRATSAYHAPAQAPAGLRSEPHVTSKTPSQASTVPTHVPTPSNPQRSEPISTKPRTKDTSRPVTLLSNIKVEDETHDLLRRFSRAASTSPSHSSSQSLQDLSEDLSLEQTPRPFRKVKDDPTPKAVPSTASAADVQPPSIRPAVAQSKRFPLVTTGSVSQSATVKQEVVETPLCARSKNTSPLGSNRLSREMVPPVRSYTAQTPSSHLRSQSTPKSSRSHTGSRSMILRSPTLSDYDDLAGFTSSPTSIKREARNSPSPTPTPERSVSRPKIPVIPKADEEYQTDDSLDRLLANDTDYSSLLRPARFQDESFLDAAAVAASTPQYPPERLQRELAEHARLVNKLQVLQLEIRDARKGIEVIEKRMTHDDGPSSQFFDDSMMLNDDPEALKKGSKNGQSRNNPVERQRSLRRRRKMGFWGKSLCLFGFIFLLMLIEFKLWSDTIIPEYSNASSNDWWAKHPPVEYQFGTSFRFYWTLVLPVLRVIGWAMSWLWTVLVWLFAGVQWVEERVMDGVMPPPVELAEGLYTMSAVPSSLTTSSATSSSSSTSRTVFGATETVSAQYVTPSSDYDQAEMETPQTEIYDDPADDPDVPGVYDRAGNWVPDIEWDTPSYL